MSEAKWYVAHTYSGYENKVKTDIEKTVENRHLEDQIFDVVIPMETVVEAKDGLRKETLRKIFPSYVLVHMIMNDDTWYVIRNTRGVTGFVGPGSKPVPLTEEELAKWGLEGNEVADKPANVIIDFAEGDTVTVISGVWAGTVGVINKIDENKQTATMNVDMFGRETPVELGFTEIKKMN